MYGTILLPAKDVRLTVDMSNISKYAICRLTGLTLHVRVSRPDVMTVLNGSHPGVFYWGELGSLMSEMKSVVVFFLT